MTQNDFDFLDELDPKTLKNEKPKNKDDLWNYLDGFDFVNVFEVLSAINDFFKWEHEEGTSYGELAEYSELAVEYSKIKKIKFVDA